jgi:hypothetical protein
MPKNIKAGFTTSSLFPLNPDIVLRSIPAPPTEIAIPRANKVEIGSYRQDIEPQIPIILVLVEAFILL